MLLNYVRKINIWIYVFLFDSLVKQMKLETEVERSFRYELAKKSGNEILKRTNLLSENKQYEDSQKSSRMMYS